jgi:hypothetical protein
VNAETNAGIHTVTRMMMEANDLNDWFNCAAPWCSRLHFRTASFCTERSGHFDGFDQGISFFLPNMSWIQPVWDMLPHGQDKCGYVRLECLHCAAPSSPGMSTR